MKLIDNYIDKYIMKKVVEEIDDNLFVYFIDRQFDIEKNVHGKWYVDINIKLKQENDDRYVWVCRIPSQRSLYLLCNIETVNKEIDKKVRQILKEKHEELG